MGVMGVVMISPTPTSVARAHKIADAWTADAITRGTRFISSVSLLVLEQEIALALDAQREADAKVADARALRKPERFELGLTHNTRCEEADIIATAIREGKE